MIKKAIVLSWLCLFIVLAASLWIWQNLPDLPRYPIHWDANNVANGFGSKNAVFFNLMIMPVTMGFLLLVFNYAPRIDPKKAGLIASSRPYAFFWIGMMIFLTLTHFLIVQNYISFEGRETLINPISGGAALGGALLLLLGNLMGKVRQNFTFGIRTPWTLSSKQAWAKTHRIVGRLLVASGFATFISLFFLSPITSLLFMVSLLFSSIIISVVLSYNFWKSDPDKHT